MENLIDVLDSENREYEKLIALAESKTPVMVGGNIEDLGKITEDEQEIVGTIQNLEKKRCKVLADVANVVNRDVETLKLIDLIQILERKPDQQQLLVEVHGRLKQTISKLKEINDKNQLLLNDAIEMVEFNLNMIRAMKTAPQTANYNKKAYSNGNVLGIFHGGFDAKQ